MSASLAERELLKRVAVHSGEFGRVAFPSRFYTPEHSLHRQITDVIDARDAFGQPKHRLIVIAAPRGTGKSFHLLLGKAAQSVAFREYMKIGYITATEPVAIEMTELLKNEMLGSRWVRKYFGSIRTQPFWDDIDLQFSKKAYTAFLPSDDPDYRGTTVIPMGAGQQIRGRRFDLILGDDLDDPKRLTNEILRRNAREWWYGDVRGTLDPYNAHSQIIYSGTMTHQDCLLARLMELPQWTVVNLSACTEDFKTLEPAYITQEDLDAKIEEYQLAGMMDVFFREFMNKPGTPDAQPFRRSHFQYYNEHDISNMLGIENVVLVDYAKTLNRKSAHTAIVCVGIDRVHNFVFVRDILARPMHDDEIYTEAIEMAARFEARTLGCETTGLNEFIEGPFRRAIEASGESIEFIALAARHGTGAYAGVGGGKDARIASLIPYYRKGWVYHNRACCDQLEEQLLAFPYGSGGRKDIADALGYVVQFMQKRGVTFTSEQKPENEFDRRRREKEAYAQLMEHQRRGAREIEAFRKPRRELGWQEMMGVN